MDKLKSKTGCLTCVARRKKCDEVEPKCGHCARLNITCVRRNRGTEREVVLISSTNLRTRRSPPLQSPITNGYPPFKSDFERQLSIESPGALAALVSCMAGPGFRDVLLFGTFCAESRLVRQALVAFSAYNQGPRYDDSYKLSLKSYQYCITTMKQNRSYEGEEPAEQDRVLTAIMFLGLLEGLKIGDSSNAVAHFEMCRKLLTARLTQPGVLNDAALVKLYRVVAECIMYNLAALSPFHVGIAQVVTDWGTSFDCLFPGGDHTLSPFLGGLHDVYRLMLRMNIYLRQIPANTASGQVSMAQAKQALDALWWELHALESKVPASYRRVEGATGTRLYKAKHKISVLALRVHLVKISRPAISCSDLLVQPYLQKAIETLKQQDIREPGNPALRWPLTILACAANLEEDFVFVVEKMRELEVILDPSNRGKLQSAYETLRRYRQGHLTAPSHTDRGSWTPVDQLDFLLEPQFLDEPGSRVVQEELSLPIVELVAEAARL